MAYQQLLLMLIVLAILYHISAQKKDTLSTGQYVLLHIVTQHTPQCGQLDYGWGDEKPAEDQVQGLASTNQHTNSSQQCHFLRSFSLGSQ